MPYLASLTEEQAWMVVVIQVAEFYHVPPMEVQHWPLTWIASTQEFVRATKEIEKRQGSN